MTLRLHKTGIEFPDNSWQDTASILDAPSDGKQYARQDENWAEVNHPPRLENYRNLLINSNFDVWQRGTSFTVTDSTNIYTADRWRFVGSSFTGTLTRQSFTPGQTDVPNNPDYFARWDVTTNASGNVGFSQLIENVQNLAGKIATVSFYLKSNSTISADTLNLRYRQVTGGTGGTNNSVNIGEITTSWKKFTLTINIPSLSGATLGASNNSYLAIDILSPTAHTSAFQLDIAQVQVEEGETATPFEHRPYDVELNRCHRYYQKSYSYETVVGTVTNTGRFNAGGDNGAGATTGLIAGPYVRYRVAMRTNPTVTLYDDQGNVNKCIRFTLGASNNSNEAVTLADNNNEGFWTYSPTGVNNSGMGIHYQSDAEL